MDGSLLAGIIVTAIVLTLIAGIILAFKSGFKGSNTTTVYGATAELYTKDKKAAMETIVEQKAKKKMEEDENGEPV